MTTFVLKSNESDVRLEFTHRHGEFFIVYFYGEGIEISKGVSTYTDEHGLANLFTWISMQEKPWNGDAVWESIEGEFKVTVSCSSLGVLAFGVQFRHLRGGEDWEAVAHLFSSLGESRLIARQAQLFFDAPTDLIRVPQMVSG